MSYSKISRRFFAYLFDTIIVSGFVCTLLLILKFLNIFDTKTLVENISKGDFSFFINYYILCFLIYLVYEVVFLTSNISSTPGKIILDMEIVSYKPSFLKGFIRSTVKVIESLSGLVIISGLVAVFTENKQSIHDLLAKTFVVDFDRRSQHIPSSMDSAEFHEEMKRRGIKTYSEQKALAQEMFGNRKKSSISFILSSPLLWAIVLVLSIIIIIIYSNVIIYQIRNFYTIVNL
ncbi:RDD family protein [Acetivibrio clariflavus]|uniref:Putative membrane protein/domain protein n=1 Tax=Acetivibrio clariflavus (strain DSM 19732 / NBRC 101661 / EBR45) TaxID=720554 RepID=G8LUE5_ACECE|nr:RDD family protein [Acetivibrio clariflavus]AEV70593.1 putative membrane protein/domain protein [Acetivibrio clariflavus DSM 19732]